MRVADFFALDSEWVRRPAAVAQRRDATVALVLFALSAIGLEMLRSGGGLRTDIPVWQEYLGLAAMAAPIAFRRRWPLGAVVVSSVAFFVVGLRMPDIAMQLSVQGLYFFALFSAMAWARDRRVALMVIAGVLLLMFGWLAYQFLLGSAVAQINEDIADPTRSRGAVNPVIAAVTYTFLVNIAYFGGAVLGGQAAWNAARRRARLATQAATLRTQAAELKEHAVVEERLRIARELHDVVAHHVSVMGVQAAAARRVLDVDPQAASSALSSVESSAREAVTEMRSLLGTLRQGDRAAAETGRAPEPSVDAIPGLVDQLRADGLDVTYSVVADPSDAATHLGPAVGLTLYRTVQEALHNVRRHSTATAAAVVLRVDGSAPNGFAEVEVLDSGRPRTGTSGTGLGLLGMRERVASLDGLARDRSASDRRVPGPGPAAPGQEVDHGRGPRRPRRRACRERRRRRDAEHVEPSPHARAGRLDPMTETLPDVLRVVVVDDQALVRSGFSMILGVEPDLEVVGEASDGAAAVEVVARLTPDVVLMDVQMPGTDGIEATREIVARDLAKVIILTTFDRDDYLVDALRAGASGFLLKNAEPEKLVDAVRVVGNGHALLAPEVTRRVIERMTAGDTHTPEIRSPATQPATPPSWTFSRTGNARSSCSSARASATARSRPSCSSARRP